MRESSKMSQIDLANELGIGQTTLSGYERGYSKPNYEIIERIAEICDFNIYFNDKNSNELYDKDGNLLKELEIIKKKKDK